MRWPVAGAWMIGGVCGGGPGITPDKLTLLLFETVPAETFMLTAIKIRPVIISSNASAGYDV